MFDPGDVINDKYEVEGICNDTGGMGTLLFVKDLLSEHEEKIVLKYCKETDEEYLLRFKREVRILNEYKGNSKIAQLLDFDLKYEPPYFVMKYYPEGDLTKKIPQLFENIALQEITFNSMIECIAEIHFKKRFHRDIKPQNFLCDGDNIIVTDFGLIVERGSKTGFTKSSTWWGTHGYIPPEFLAKGGFKDADASSDIFMLGKSFYVLITGKDPVYIIEDGIPAPLYHVIDRCCALNKALRYQTLSDLKQSLTAAFDVLLNRINSVGEVNQLLLEINDILVKENKYNPVQVFKFLEKMALLEEEDKIKMCFNLEPRFFKVIIQDPISNELNNFLNIYKIMVESECYGWAFAETIAKNMKVVFESSVTPASKALALSLAIEGAKRMNRFAAMDTCVEMIVSVDNEELGLVIADVIKAHAYYFISDIEQSKCNSDAVRKAITFIKELE